MDFLLLSGSTIGQSLKSQYISWTFWKNILKEAKIFFHFLQSISMVLVDIQGLGGFV